MPDHSASAAGAFPPSSAPCCKACRSSLIKRSHRAGLVDRLLSLLGTYPYRCHDCHSRFRLHAHSVAAATTPASEKRRERARADALRTRRTVLLFALGVLLFFLFAWFIILGPPSFAPPE